MTTKKVEQNVKEDSFRQWLKNQVKKKGAKVQRKLQIMWTRLVILLEEEKTEESPNKGFKVLIMDEIMEK